MLLSNWLETLTSRLRKRPVFRSRNRRAFRRHWQLGLNNQVSTVEVLEDRTLLTTVTGTTPHGTGTLEVEATSLDVIFSELVNGADVTGNYILVAAGADGLLGSADDMAISVETASYDSGTNTATLSFAALVEDIYRLTVKDAITDGSSNALDGDDDGIAGGDTTVDFVVGAEPTSLTTHGGYEFDPETIGCGAGQLVQGTNGEFDGLNRLQVGGVDYTPTEHSGPTVEVETLRVTTTVQDTGSSEFIDIPELSKTVTLTEETLFNLRATVTTHNNSDVTRLMRILIDGNPLDERYWIYSGGEGLVPLSREENVLLSAGVHTIQVQVKVVGGGVQAYNDGSKLEIMQYPPAAPLIDDAGQTLITGSQSLSDLDVHREITVPNTGGQDFARTVDVFHNPTESAITETVTIVGNLGSDGQTVVFNTSDGDTIVEPTDLWIGTDDADGSDTPAIVHYIHGPQGLIPATIELLGDNIYWTYEITVDPGETVRLAYLTILGDNRADVEAAANALVSSTGFTGEAGSFLTGGELTSLLNFQFDSVPGDPPTVVYVNSNFINPVAGQDPDGAGSPATQFGFDAFATIQAAINAVADGGTIHIAAGTYSGNVDATAKSVTLSPGNSPGQVVINGNLTLDSDDTLDIEINGVTPGSGFDQFVVNGAVTLNGADLNLIDGYNPADGDQFLLIDNDAEDTVTNTFSGWPEGYEFVDFLGVSRQNGYLTYVGGDGNDVVIKVRNLETVSLRIVDVPTATDANGETAVVPTSQDWISEWGSYWVEIWVSTADSTSQGIATVSLDLSYQTNFTSATEIEYGSTFSQNQTGTINDPYGLIQNLSATADTTDLGVNKQLLFARIKFESLADDQIVLDLEGQSIGSHDLGFQMQIPQLSLGSGKVSTTPLIDSIGADIWANPFDLNDDDQINYRDLIQFVGLYNTRPSESGSEYAWFSDFDQSDRIDYRDLISLVSNYGKSKLKESVINYPVNYPDAWDQQLQVSLTPQTGTKTSPLTQSLAETALQTAIDDVSLQLPDESQQQLANVKIEVVDLNGTTLARAAGNTIYLDTDAAGYGWFVDVTPLDHSEFQYDSNLSLIALPGSEAEGLVDLWTVIRHELGHLLGYEHADEGLMEAVLDPGERKLPDWTDESDLFFASLEEDTELLSF